MAGYKIKSCKAVACILLSCLTLTAIIVLFTMGGVFFSKENPKVRNYASSICQVDSSSYTNYICESRYYTYTCYGPKWRVHYGERNTISAVVEQDRRYTDYRDALEKANQYQVGSSYPCWYDTRHPSVAQWDKPSTQIAIILLSCGGLSVLLTIILIFIAVKLIQQEKLQNSHDAMDPYSQNNPYMKQ